MNIPSDPIPAICLYGPTASGKTDLAIELSRQFGCDIISVDSALVYRGLDIGTAKPDSETLAQWPHRLVDVADAWQPFSVSDFCTEAACAIRDSAAAGRVPVLVGGTMLYFRALLNGLNALPAADPSIRSALACRLESEGLDALRRELAQVDPALDARLAANDRQRTLRGLEVWHGSGRSLSDWQQSPAVPLIPIRPLELTLWPEPRTALHQLIETRFDAMLGAGFLDEVAALRDDERMHAELPSMRSVGYRQAWQHLDGDCDFAEFRARAIAATRQLAKRQFTWLRQYPDAARLNPYQPLAGEHPFVQRVGEWLETVK